MRKTVVIYTVVTPVMAVVGGIVFDGVVKVVVM